MAIWFLIFVYGVLLEGSQAESDPCDTDQVLHRHGDRGAGCVAGSNQVCDRYAIDETVWYKVPNKHGDKPYVDMTTSAPELNHCGTSFPIWLNGSLPHGNRTEANLTACMRGLKSKCQTSYNITAMNCNGYHVYKLRATDACNSAYCFGGGHCETTPTTAPVSPGPSTVDPGVSEPCKTPHILHRAGGRGTQCSSNANSSICDRYAVEDVWYRVISGGKDLQLVTKPPPVNNCGTSFPIWMNGTHPTNGATVNRTTCEQGIDESCIHEYNISIKHCDSYYVYKLQSTIVCDSAYCFGQDRGCSSGVQLSPLAVLLAVHVGVVRVIGSFGFYL